MIRMVEKPCKLAVLLLLRAAFAQGDALAGAGADGDTGSRLMRAGSISDRLEMSGGNPLWAVPLRALSVTRERPLFSASRRPPEPPAVAIAEPPPPPRAPPPPSKPSLVLLGTIIGGASRIGIFLDEATTKTMRLMVGESHDGWVLSAVTAADARFEAADRAATLVLRPAAQLAMQGVPVTAGDEPMPIVRRRKR